MLKNFNAIKIAVIVILATLGMPSSAYAKDTHSGSEAFFFYDRQYNDYDDYEYDCKYHEDDYDYHYINDHTSFCNSDS
jgi:hypothetical protein